MRPTEQLVWFCWIYLAVIFAAMVIPYVRGKSDLITAWNLFLLGLTNFIGVAGLQAGYRPDFFFIVELDRSDYHNYIVGAIVFTATLFATYCFARFPRKVAGTYLRKWPPVSDTALILLLVVALAMALGLIFAPGVVGLRQLVGQLATKSLAIAVALAFVPWLKNRTNPVYAGIFVAVLLSAMLFSIVSGGGRRTMLSVLMAVPICYYWIVLRYKSPTRNLLVFSAAAVIVAAMIGAYSQVRHFDRRGEKQERSISNSLAALSKLPSKLASSELLPFLGQNAGQTALSAIHIYSNDRDPEPFHAVKFVLSGPVPRALWPEKPVALGKLLPQASGVRWTRATWGPGIIGHGFHEGGLHMLIFYGLLAGAALRAADEWLVRQPENPYLLGGFAAMSAHIAGWPRGDIGTFTIQVIGGILAILILSYVGRLVLGVGRVYPRTDGPAYVGINQFAATLGAARRAAR